jgi:hypothetical protein
MKDASGDAPRCDGASRLWLSTEADDLDRRIHGINAFPEQIMPHFR